MTEIIRGEIENWIAWCWEGQSPAPGESSRARSAEGRYVPRAQPDEEERAPRRVICHARAMRVQQAYNSMPLLTRQVLRYEYTQRAAYDKWEQAQDVGPDGAVKTTLVWVANTRRLMARQQLGISRQSYREAVDAFLSAVREEFESEIRR